MYYPIVKIIAFVSLDLQSCIQNMRMSECQNI